MNHPKHREVMSTSKSVSVGSAGSAVSYGHRAQVPSDKPWFLTHNPADHDVLVWKNGVRLRLLSDGTAAGRLLSVSVLSEEHKTLTVSRCLVKRNNIKTFSTAEGGF